MQASGQSSDFSPAFLCNPLGLIAELCEAGTGRFGIDFAKKFDEFKLWVDDKFEMPDKLVSLLVRFLEQNNGLLSERARIKEFAGLNKDEIKLIENQYQIIFK